jgi:hypothetical protein
MENLASEADIAAVDVKDALPGCSLVRPCREVYEMIEAHDDSLSHANTEYGNFASKVLDGLATDTRIGFWMARSRTHDQLGWLLGNELFQGDLVVSENCHPGSLKNEVLIDVPGE